MLMFSWYEGKKGEKRSFNFFRSILKLKKKKKHRNELIFVFQCFCITCISNFQIIAFIIVTNDVKSLVFARMVRQMRMWENVYNAGASSQFVIKFSYSSS